ncbi:MAG TPA: 50S ribosomal protein L19 [Pseudobdellovibrionaceae bacterium]|nr:50S ribosomal protein L19 [Pseudobdellovibrionaceae bacterium]
MKQTNQKNQKSGTQAGSEKTETNLIRRIVAKSANKNIDNFRTGDTVSVSVKVKEGDKERSQVYKGVVIKIQGSGTSRSFTVRKISAGVGVERTFPFYSPSVEKVELYSHGQVRRSKLYYLRKLDGKAARIDSTLATTSSSSAESEASSN